MSQKRVSQVITTTILVLMAAEGAWARTATAPRPTVEATRPAALGAGTVAASMSVGAAQATVNAATKTSVVSSNTKQKLIDGLSSSNLDEVRAANELLAGLKSSDTSMKSQILSSLANGSVVQAAAAVARSNAAGQELLARANEAGKESQSGGTCQNVPSVPASAASIIDVKQPLKDCGLSLPAFNVAVEVAAAVAADGNPNNDAIQFAQALDERNPNITGKAESIAAVKKVFGECINGTPAFQKQVQAL